MPDNDQFVRASRSACSVFKVSSLESGDQHVEADLVRLATVVEKLIAACGGVPLGPLLTALDGANEGPLFANTQEARDKRLDAIESASDSAFRSPLDLVLRRAAVREALDGRCDALSIAQRFFGDLVARYAIEAKKGLVDQVAPQTLSRERGRLERDMHPVIRLAAEQLAKNPGLRRLSIASHFRAQSDIAVDDLSMGGFSYGASA